MRTIVGPHGQKRPADVAANAVHVGKLLVGDIEETYVEREPIWSRLRLRVYWVSIGATQEHPSEGILWHEVLAREGVPWNQRVRGYVRKTAEGWVLRPAGFFNAERKLYLSLEDAVKAILNNEMWQGSSSGKKILLLSGKRLFGTLRLSTRLFSQE